MVDTSQNDSISQNRSDSTPSSRGSFYTSTSKRFFDLGLAFFLAPLLVLPILVLALLVKRDGGPAFFGHKRAGKGGKEFKCLKLRSMRPDAESYLEEYLAENEAARIEWEENF